MWIGLVGRTWASQLCDRTLASQSCFSSPIAGFCLFT